jgi:hypothetical protein
MKYNIGDVVQMNSMWDNRYGIIVEVDKKEDEYPAVYRILVQGKAMPGWMSEFVIVRKID